MMCIFKFLLVAASAVLLCSCNQPSGSGGTNAVVVDLDAVARAMGRDTLIDKRVEQATQTLNSKLIEAAANMEKEFKKQQTEFGTSPTDEQRGKLKQTAQKIQENIQNNKENASQARQRVRLEQIQIFRNEVKAIAARLAAKRQASLVMVANQDVLWFTPSSDITAAVIAEMRSPAAAPTAETGSAPASARTNAAPPSPPGDESRAQSTNENH